jgi:hypothetical protein
MSEETIEEKRIRMRARAEKMRAERNDPLGLIRVVQRNEIRFLESFPITDKNRNGENELGETALIVAILNQNYLICQHLLKKGVDPNYVNNMGHTALSLLCYGVDSKPMTVMDMRLILLLLRYGAKTDLPTTQKRADELLRDMGYETHGIYLRKRITKRCAP